MFPGPPEYTETQRFSGFRLIVYKHGTEVGDFYDTNEELIAIKSRLSDPQLGPMDLVGESVDTLQKQFGVPFAVVDDVLIYYGDSRAISLGTSNGKVNWYKYVRLDRSLADPADIPACLLKF